MRMTKAETCRLVNCDGLTQISPEPEPCGQVLTPRRHATTQPIRIPILTTKDTKSTKKNHAGAVTDPAILWNKDFFTDAKVKTRNGPPCQWGWLKNTTLQGRGRHDPCVLPRAVPMVEAMASLVLVDHALRQRGQCGRRLGPRKLVNKMNAYQFPRTLQPSLK